jgi:DNA segregation ATPase FtsK/SpoIIIE-like protein
VTIEQLEARHYIKPGPVATIGLGLQDEPKRVNFTDAAMAHVFISGQTRSGKTNAEKLIAWNLAHNTTPTEARLFVFDVAKRGYKWADFDNVAHLAHPVIKTVSEADKVLSWLNLEIERRAGQRRKSPRLFILIDELKALGDDSKVATGYLSRIASTGGEFGLHLVLSTQYPQIKMLGSAELKRNVTTRLCGRVDDAQAAVNALGMPDSGAETLGGYGDFLLKDFNGLSRLTVAHVQAKHISQLPRAEIRPIPLPDDDTVNDGAQPTRQPDELEPEQIALALFKPMGINRLAGELSIGSTKATRVKQFADRIRQWAIEHGYNCIEA